MKIEIGGGSMPRKGFKQLGIETNFNIITDEIEVGNSSVDFFYLSHVIEHMTVWTAEKVLKKMFLKLKKGGQIRILCPDLEQIIKAYNNKDYSQFNRSKNHWGTVHSLNKKLGIGGYLMSQIVSKPDSNRPGDSFIVSNKKIVDTITHICCYDYEMLHNLLKIVGFEKIERSFIDDNFDDTWKENGQLVLNAWK